MILILLLAYFHMVSGQASQWIDTFQKTVCHQRWSQMDWLTILRPCRYKMEFGKKVDVKDRTSTKWSHTLGLHFARTGEFSKLAIQSRKSDGRNKKTGGDTWRVFIRGNDMITPFISDLNNGVYEADFIAISPGFYKIEIVLESTLCQAYEDPPLDWLKRDPSTIISDEKAKLLWEPLRGGNISFKIEVGSEESANELKKNFHRYKDSCGSQYACELLWKGIGRWSNHTWIPYVNEPARSRGDSDVDCYREKEGILKISGDDLTRRFSLSNYTQELCNAVFSECRWEGKGEQPDVKLYTGRNSSSTPTVFSTKEYLQSLKKVLAQDYMGKSSGLLLNYGHPFVQNMPFKRWRSFIDRTTRIIKEKYKGRAVWQTMSSRWMESNSADDHFKNHQRIKLFNAYATSVMCSAGIAVLDVFQMTESAPASSKSPLELKTIAQILIEYFKAYPVRKCPEKTKEDQNARITSDPKNIVDANVIRANVPTAGKGAKVATAGKGTNAQPAPPKRSVKSAVDEFFPIIEESVAKTFVNASNLDKLDEFK